MSKASPYELTVEAALAQVATQLNNGNAQSAMHIAQQVAAQRPAHAHAHHLLGIAAHQMGDHTLTRAHLEKSLSLDPQNGGYFTNAAEIFRQIDDTTRAIACGKEGSRLSPTSAVAETNLGLAYYDAGDLAAAKSCQTRAIAIDPGHVNALNNLGSIARDEGNLDTAQSYYQRAVVLAPDYIEAATNLASVLIELHKREEARKMLEDVLERAPRHPEALRAMAHYQLLVPDLDEAEKAARSALMATGGDADGYALLAQVMLAKNRADLARIEAEKAISADANHHTAHHELALALADLGDADAARRHYEQALAIKPGFAPSLLALGYLALEFGDKDAARARFETVEAADPDDVSAKIALLRVVKVDRSDHPLLLAVERAADIADQEPPEKAAAVFYALGSAYEQLNDNRAFDAFAKGAALKRKTISYDANAYDARVDTLISTMTAERISGLRAGAINTNAPIFIVGMPRSGTTLTESILSAHSQVDGAGELPHLQNLFSSAPSDAPIDYATWPAEGLAEQARSYLAKLQDCGDGAPHICDKMPANFHMIGLIHAVMPNAKIIHIQRDPCDTCLSMFTRLFERSQNMSYDLRELGRAYRAYERIVSHWRRVLPPDAFLEVHYEDLIDDFETEAKRLLNFCNLDWEPGILEFHTSTRRVRTASVTQVRQKIYASSVGKWQRYSAELTDLLEELGAVPDR